MTSGALASDVSASFLPLVTAGMVFPSLTSRKEVRSIAKRDRLRYGVHIARIPGSYKTAYNHRMEALRFVATLRELGYGVQKWSNVTNKHVAAVVTAWKERGLQDKTIAEYLSGVRVMARIWGNERIHADNAAFGLTRGVSTPKNVDQSAREEVMQRALERLQRGDYNQQRLAVQVAYMRYLGLRSEEARKLDALHAQREVSPAGQEYIRITAGTKGGKERWVPVSTQAREALTRGAQLQRETGTRNTMPREMREKAWVQYMYREARAMGLTRAQGASFHQLRHSFAQELFRQIAGFAPPVKFADRSAFIAAAEEAVGEKWRDHYEQACQVVENALGHGPGRSDVRGTYIGRY